MMFCHPRSPVGASLLAMVANDDTGPLTPRGFLRFFASKLAPTVFCVLLGIPGLAHAFDLQQLSEQLAKPEVIHGNFIQEKHLRALSQPLTSKGTFVLAKNHGLLWLLKTPLQQDYRITAKGIARRDGSVWQMLPGKSAGAEQNRLKINYLISDPQTGERLTRAMSIQVAVDLASREMQLASPTVFTDAVERALP